MTHGPNVQLIELLGECPFESSSTRGTRRTIVRTIVHNDAHAPVRQNSNLAHELSHGLLHHPPTPALDNKGCRNWNQDIEDEAQWLAGALLVTEDAALALARARQPLAAVANRFQVSEPMIQFRLNVTGARNRVDRARRARS